MSLPQDRERLGPEATSPPFSSYCLSAWRLLGWKLSSAGRLGPGLERVGASGSHGNEELCNHSLPLWAFPLNWECISRTESGAPGGQHLRGGRALGSGGHRARSLPDHQHAPPNPTLGLPGPGWSRGQLRLDAQRKPSRCTALWKPTPHRAWGGSESTDSSPLGAGHHSFTQFLH